LRGAARPGRARVLELGLDLACDLVREENRAVVVDLGRLDDDADLAAGLEGVNALDPIAAARELLERGQALDVVLEALAAGAGACCRDRVGGDQEHRLDGLGLDLVVMGLDRVHDALALAIALRELRGDARVRPLDLVRHRLADVVQERRAPRRLHARLELGRHDPGQVDDLERVLEHVLPVARPVAQAPEDLHQLLVEVAAVRLEDCLLAGLAHQLVDLRLRLVVRLLDPRRVDPAVLDQLRERHLRDLAAQAVERREDDGLRRVVDDEVDPGQVLERPDIPALAPDDAPLHVVGGELDDGDGRLGRVARRHALEGVGDEVARLPLRLDARLLLELADPPGQLVPDEVLGALEQLRLRLTDRHPGDPLQLLELVVARLLELLLELLRVRLAVGEPLLAARDLDVLRLDLVLPRVQALLALHHLRAPLSEFLLELGPQPDRLLARLDLRFAAERLGLAAPVGEDLLAHAARRAEPGAAPERDRGQRQGRADRKSDE
jgi:hypothetical protein